MNTEWGGGRIYTGMGKVWKSMTDGESPAVGNSRTLFPPLGLKTNDRTVSGGAAATGEGPLASDTAITNLSSSKEGEEGIRAETSGILLVSCQSFQMARLYWDTDRKEGAR